MIQKFLYRSPFKLDSNEVLPEFELSYSVQGRLNKNKDNVVWICHALTGNANPEGWWSGLVGEGKTFDPSKHFIVCANVLGSCYGSTGPLSKSPSTGRPYYHDFPHLTIRDIVNSLDLLRNHLQITRIQYLVGGSLGGQQALEWSIKQPDKIINLILVATNAKHSPWGIAFNESQRLAIASDVSWKENRKEAGQNGLATARSIALLSYRNYSTYHKTQQDDNDKIDDFNASSYQRYQGQKFINRFNAFSYWVLSKAMDSHDVSRGRKSFSNALGFIKAKTLVIGITTDLLFPISESVFITQHIKNSQLKIIDSIYGHDGFLIESEQIHNSIIESYLPVKEMI